MGCLRTSFSTLVTLAAVLYGFGAGAQAPTASVTGVVRTESGATIPGVRVTVTNRTTGSTRTAATDANGHYAIAEVTPGAYTVTAAVVGYRKISQQRRSR